MNFDWSSVDNTLPFFTMEGEHLVGKCVDVYDGDTVKIVMPIVLDGKLTNKLFRWNCRINRVDTPEIRTKNKKEKDYAKVVRNALREKVLNKLVFVKCLDFDKYGRLLTELYINDDYNYENIDCNNCNDKLLNISNWLVNNKYAKEYFGGSKSKWFVDE